MQFADILAHSTEAPRSTGLVDRGLISGIPVAGKQHPGAISTTQPAAGNTFSSVESIDDENRSSVRVDLSRELSDSLRLVARYTFYVNELANASSISYQRQTLLLSVTGALEK